MKMLKRFSSRNNRTGSSGQAVILLAVSFLILLAFVGLTTDVGLLFIYMGHLRRAVDAASLAAAAQYREARTVAEMTAAAAQVMELNGVDADSYTITVQTCDTNPLDARLCTTPRRKLVRVSSDLRVPTTFLRLVGVNDIRISANSVSEAASLDVVLVIDISNSMTRDAPVGNTLRDPFACNSEDAAGADGFDGECHPFEEVKAAAINFTNRILNKPPGDEEDRLQIITFANGWSPDVNQGTDYRFKDTSVTPAVPRWSSDRDEVVNMIQALKVYEPGSCTSPRNEWEYNLTDATVHTYYGPCRAYFEDNNYAGFDCVACQDQGIWGDFDWPDGFSDWSTFPTTNIGGGLRRAGNMFTYQTREDALWVVVLLTDGLANATDRDSADRVNIQATYPIGYCPDAVVANGNMLAILPNCQDEDIDTRHTLGDDDYDADDYARDMADFVGCLSVNEADSCADSGQGRDHVRHRSGRRSAQFDQRSAWPSLWWRINALRGSARVRWRYGRRSLRCIPGL